MMYMEETNKKRNKMVVGRRGTGEGTVDDLFAKTANPKKVPLFEGKKY